MSRSAKESKIPKADEQIQVSKMVSAARSKPMDLSEIECEWEQTFIASIEHSRTVPYISLFKLKMMRIEFQGSGGWQNLKQKLNLNASFGYTQYIKAFFSENVLSKRKKKIEEIFEVDDGPNAFDYSSQLGLEFWSLYCNVEKNFLKRSIASEFWEMKQDEKQAKERLVHLAEKHTGYFSFVQGVVLFIWSFLKGEYSPVRAPHKRITPEERFRVQSLASLTAADQEIIPPREYKTLKEKFIRQLLYIYKALVDYLGGKWPRIRLPTLEEVYDDMLIWMLDLNNSKERIDAIMNDRIKKQII